MLSTYTIPPNTHKRRQKISITNLNDDSYREHDLKRPQMASKDLKRLESLNLSRTWTPPLITHGIRKAN